VAPTDSALSAAAAGSIPENRVTIFSVQCSVFGRTNVVVVVSMSRKADAVGALVGSELRVMAGVVSLAAVLAEGAGAAVRGGGWGTAGT
jgi:hypothetical protein